LNAFIRKRQQVVNEKGERVMRTPTPWSKADLDREIEAGRLKKAEQDLDEKLERWVWKDYHVRDDALYSREDMKKIVKKSQTHQGLKILRDWTGQDLERPEETGVRELSGFLNWFEINEKILKKRLKRDKIGFKKLLEQLKEVSPPGLQLRKGWKFFGWFRPEEPEKVMPLPRVLEKAWEESPRGGCLVPLEQAKEDIIESRRDQMRVVKNGARVHSDNLSVEPWDTIELGDLGYQEPDQISVWDIKPWSQAM
jgi:hypothetical protein